MRNSNNKLDQANVVAAFYLQDESDEALLGLRSLGFRDSQIGYYAPAGNGEMRDNLAQYHRFAAALIWGCVGVAVALLISGALIRAGVNIDPWGLAVTSSVFGALLFGTIGGMMGLSRSRNGTFARMPEGVPETYFLAVDAGAARNEALSVLQQHGGHEVENTHGHSKVLAS